MNDEKPIWEYFENKERIEAFGDSKIENHIIWHELGHMIGFVITREFGFNFGEITKIKLTNEDGNPCIKLDSSIFRARGKISPNKIDWEIGEYVYESEDKVRLSEELNDSFKFLIYSIYLLLGGLFGIYVLNKNPSLKDFKDCFLDELREIEPGSYKASAGNDWTKLRSLIQLKSWNEEIFFEFRCELFYLLKEYNIFELFREFIQKTNSDYNGKVIPKKKIKKMIEEVTSVLTEVRGFKESLNKLVNDAHSKLIRK